MIRPFGVLPDGQAVDLVCLQNGALSCQVLTWGATLRSLTVDGVDVVLGYDDLQEYISRSGHLGATVGRLANRLSYSVFDLDGVTYHVASNKPPHHTHGGIDQFSNRVWAVTEQSDSQATFTLVSPDGDQGYPGELTVSVTYTLTDKALELHYKATTDKPTLCNLTNHTYFNLSGQESGDVLDQKVKLFCSAYTPVQKDGMLTGEILPVAGTPMDFLEAHPIGQWIDQDDPQLRYCDGYDHNFVVDGSLNPDGTLAPAALRSVAWAKSERTGIVMETFSTLPGVQFFTANALNAPGKNGAVYGRRQGFCLETQFLPDAPHHAAFPQPVLRPGQVWDHRTVYSFSK